MIQYKLSANTSMLLRQKNKVFFKDLSKATPSDIKNYNEKQFRHCGAFKRLYCPVKFGITTSQYIIPVQDGSAISAVLFKRKYAKLTDPTSLIIYFHDGGWVAGNMEVTSAICSNICKVTGSHVLAVDYRLAPEFKFPTPITDCYDAFVWSHIGAKYWKLNQSQIFLMGSGAGANLAIAVSRLARDKKGPQPAGMILLDAITDCRLATVSSYKHSENPFLSSKEISICISQYQKEAKDVLNPLFSPLAAKDHSRLPATLMFSAELDPLYENALLFSKMLKQAEVPVQFITEKERFHYFMNFPKSEGWRDRMECISDFVHGVSVNSLKVLTKKERANSAKSQVLLVR